MPNVKLVNGIHPIDSMTDNKLRYLGAAVAEAIHAIDIYGVLVSPECRNTLAEFMAQVNTSMIGLKTRNPQNRKES